MLRSLFSGVSGMKNNQTKMDVIGNNIANVNTTAFKVGRVTFKDMLSQTVQQASSPAGGIGGTNPKQVGLGMAISSIDTNMNQGALQPTGRSTDMAIEGNGFFVVASVNPTTHAPVETLYTRDGNFTIDNDGSLITSSGLHVMGMTNTAIYGTAPSLTSYAPDTFTPGTTTVANYKDIRIPLEITEGTNKVKITSFGVEKDGTIKAIYGDKTYVVGQIGLANFQNPAGLEKSGGNMYRTSSNSGAPQAGRGVTDSGFGTVQQGILEMSNVDLAEQFTDMIVTSRAFQANSRTITTSDEMLQELLNLKR